MGNKTSLWALAGLIICILIASRLAVHGSSMADENENTSVEDSSADDISSNNVQIQNSKSQLVSQKTHSQSRNLSSVPDTGKMERKFRAPPDDSNPHKISNRQPASAELKSISLALEDRHWKIWQGVTAIPEHLFQNDRKGNIAGRINGYILIKTNEDLNLEAFSSENPLVVYNERLAQPGVVTGTLIVKLKQTEGINDLLNEYKLKSRDSFPEINLYYISASDQPSNLSDLFKSLQQDARVEKVELEILNRQYEKK